MNQPQMQPQETPEEPTPNLPHVEPHEPPEEPPPFLSTWRNVYALVLIELALTVIAFFALTRWAS